MRFSLQTLLMMFFEVDKEIIAYEGNGDDRFDGGLGNDTIKGNRSADCYVLSSGNCVIVSFSFEENGRIVIEDGVDLCLK